MNKTTGAGCGYSGKGAHAGVDSNVESENFFGGTQEERVSFIVRMYVYACISGFAFRFIISSQYSYVKHFPCTEGCTAGSTTDDSPDAKRD